MLRSGFRTSWVLWAGLLAALAASLGAASPGGPGAPRRPARDALGGERYAVVVGANGYVYLNPLSRAMKDAQDLASRLEGLGFHVILLTDKSPDRRPYGPEDIRRALVAYAAKAKPGDTILFSFSGHGFGHRIGGVDHDYICPLTAGPNPSTSFALEEVREILKRSMATNKLLLVDACRSDGPGVAHGFREQAKDREYGVVSLYSTQPASVSRECPAALHVHDVDGNLIDNGVFTHFILRGLSGEADLDGNGALTFRELGFFVAQEMNNFSFARPDLYQLPFWEKEMAKQDPLVGLVDKAHVAPEFQPGTPESVLREAFQQQLGTCGSFLNQKFLADGRYGTDAKYRARVIGAIGAALRERFLQGFRTPDGAEDKPGLERFLEIVQATIEMEAGSEEALRALAVGAKVEELHSRLVVLGTIAGLEAARGNAAVQTILDELLVPYCRMAIDARDDSVLEFLFGSDRFEIREKTTRELQRGIHRMEEMHFTNWTRKLALRFEGLLEEMPIGIVRERFHQALASEDWESAAGMAQGLEARGDDAALGKLTGALDAWVERRAAPDRTGVADMRAVAAAVSGLPRAREALQNSVAKRVRAAVAEANSGAALARLPEWRALAEAAGLDHKVWKGIVASSIDRLREAVRTALPPPGDVTACLFPPNRVLPLLIEVRPDLQDEFRDLFHERALASLRHSRRDAERYLAEYELAIDLGFARPAVIEDLFPQDHRQHPPENLEEASDTIAALRAVVRWRQGDLGDLHDVLRSVARGTLTLGASAPLVPLLEMKGAPALLAPVASGEINRAIHAAPGNVPRLEKVLAMIERLAPAFEEAGHPLSFDAAALRAGIVGAARAGGNDPGGLEALIRHAARVHVSFEPAEMTEIRGLLVAATPEGDAALEDRIARLLEVLPEGRFPAAPAARLFEHFYALGDWNRARDWIEAAGDRVARERVEEVGRRIAFRDAVAAWQGKRIPIVRKATVQRGPHGSRVARLGLLRIDRVEGFTLTGVELQEQDQIASFKGVIGDEEIVIATDGKAGRRAISFHEAHFRREGSYATIPLYRATDTSEHETEIEIFLLDPTAQAVLFDSHSCSVPRHRDVKKGWWVPYFGGSQTPLFPLFLKAKADITWDVLETCSAGDRILSGTLVVPGDVKRGAFERYKKSQSSTKKRAKKTKLLVYVDNSAQPDTITLDPQGNPTDWRVAIPQGTTKIRLALEGPVPGQLLCVHCVLRPASP